MYKALSTPKLGECELATRIDLAKKRLNSWPLDRMNFIMMDLERPRMETRQAHWWTGDLTGRILEFMSYADGVTDYNPDWVHDMFGRILRTRQPDGLFGNEHMNQGDNKLLSGLLSYYHRYGDRRALDGAISTGNHLAAHPEYWMDYLLPEKLTGAADWELDEDKKTYKLIGGGQNWHKYNTKPRTQGFSEWMIEPFAELYRLTGDAKWLEAVERFGLDSEKRHGVNGRHAHNYLTMLRGLMYLAQHTGDMKWAERPEKSRAEIIERQLNNAAGDVCEGLPWTVRNEACATADWIRLNLMYGFLHADDEAYEQAEHSLINALYFSQIVTGGMGHRTLAPWGYGTREYQEAWWCCTMNGGMALVDVARHAATLDGDTLRINFFLPGTFSLIRNGRPLTVRMNTAWPVRAEAEIEVTGETEGLKLHVRVPSCVRGAEITEKWNCGILTACFRGRIGYTVEKWKDGLYTVKHGVQLLAPMDLVVGAVYQPTENISEIPAGYVNGSIPSGWLKLHLPEPDEDGFVPLQHDPIPDWTYFEEGPSSVTGWGELAVNVEAEDETGKRRVMRFQPLSYAVSTLVFYGTPIVFAKA